MENKKSLAAFYLLAGAVVAAVSFAVIYYGFVRVPPDMKLKAETTRDAAPPKKAPPHPTETINISKPRVTQTGNGKVNWRVSADEIKAMPGEGTSEFLAPKGAVFGNSGQVLTFSAPNAVYDARDKMLRVDGRFTGTLEPGGEKFTADNLRWEQRAYSVTADNPDILMNGARARADTLKIDTASKTVSLEGGVRIEIPLQRKK